jgi:hypothetical protein
VLSSQVEGTQSSLSDLLLNENDEAAGAPIEEVKSPFNVSSACQEKVYIGAMREKSRIPKCAREARVLGEIAMA